MEDIRQQIIVNNNTDIQKLIHIFIQELGDNYIGYTPKALVILLRNNFGLEVTEKDIQLYLEPTIQEEQTDLLLQLKHLNL